jgi:hypothetical protein
MVKKLIIIGPEGGEVEVAISEEDLLREPDGILEEAIRSYSRICENSGIHGTKKDWLDPIVRDAELILMDRKYGKER